VALNLKQLVPHNLLLPGNVPGAKTTPGILPGSPTMHSGTTIDHFLKASSTRSAHWSRIESKLLFVL